MIITKNLEDQQVIDIIKPYCQDLRKIKNIKKVVITDHPFDSNMDTFFVITRVKGKMLWEIVYHEPHVMSNQLIIDGYFNIIETKSILNIQSPIISSHSFEG